MSELAGCILISIGVLFDLFGCIGLIRLPDVYNRLQASTKCVTLGTCTLLFGVFIWEGLVPMGMKSLATILFIAITAPTAAHALSRGAHRAGIKPWEGTILDHYKEDREGATHEKA